MTEYGPMVLLSPDRRFPEPELTASGHSAARGTGEGPVLLREFRDIFPYLKASPNTRGPVWIDPVLFMTGNADISLLEGPDLSRAGIRVLDFFGTSGSLRILRNAWSKEALSRKGVLRVTIRAASRGEFDIRKADLIYFLCRNLGEVKRIRCRRISEAGGASEEMQDLAVLRMAAGCLVHIDCSSLPRHAGAESWEYAARGILYACDEKKDSELRVELRTPDKQPLEIASLSEIPEISALFSGPQAGDNEIADLKRAGSAWQGLEKSVKDGDAVWL